MMTTAPPKISVNLSVYNTEKYLSAAINSILKQTFQDFEFIIIDDGSTDGSREILKKFALNDSRIRIYFQQNKGVAKARNLALQHSVGEYIVVMDSDDISLPNRLALQQSYLDTHQDIDAIGSQWQMINSSGESAGIDTHSITAEDVETLMYAYFSLHHPTTMIRRKSMLKVGGYNEDEGRLCVDYHLFIKMQLNGSKFTNLPYVLFKWRLNPDGITHSKANRQTSYVFKTRDEGFSQLLIQKQKNAYSIARRIVYTFPTGTWQDHKIQKLLPESGDSLLYKTWLSLPTKTAEEQLFRSIVQWLRHPNKNTGELISQLQKNEFPWLASLINARQNQGKVLPLLPIDLPVIRSSERNSLISLFIPFATSEKDFSERLIQAQQIQQQSNLSIELIVFSANETPLPTNLLPAANQHLNINVQQTPFSWKSALNTAKGQYFIYLEENYRFHNKKVIALLSTTIKSKTALTYLLATQFYTEALNEHGLPVLDDSPSPTWNCSTLLAKDRLSLTGFIHQCSLFNILKINLNECNDILPRVLARHLAIHNTFSIQEGAVDYFIPATSLHGTPLKAFQRTILDWYIDYGMTGLPAINVWSRLSSTNKDKYAQALSDAWLQKKLFIFPSNESTIKLFYLEHVSRPQNFPLFNHLLVHNKKMMLTSLWHKKKTILFFIASMICIKTIIKNRLPHPMNN